MAATILFTYGMDWVPEMGTTSLIPYIVASCARGRGLTTRACGISLTSSTDTSNGEVSELPEDFGGISVMLIV